MTPKERAIELFNKFEEESYIETKDTSKSHALICINEMIEISDDSNEQRFLEEVKSEIEKL